MSNSSLAIIFVPIVVNITIDIELIGINIAETNGDKVPCTAKLSPTKLYKNDIK